MKRLILGLIAALFAASLQAQSDVCLTGSGSTCALGVVKQTTAEDDAKTPPARVQHNTALCLSKGLAKTCTQAQLNAVAGCGSGACGTIYAATLAGNRQFALDKMVPGYFTIIANITQSNDIAALQTQAIPNGASIATNTECANAVGGSTCSGGNGCNRYQLACCALTNGVASDCKP